MNLPRIQHINPRRIAAPFDHPDWLFELKHDGYRAVAWCQESGPCKNVQVLRRLTGQIIHGSVMQIHWKGVIVPNGDMVLQVKYPWQGALLEALVEFDPEQLPIKISTAQRVISARLCEVTPLDTNGLHLPMQSAVCVY